VEDVADDAVVHGRGEVFEHEFDVIAGQRLAVVDGAERPGGGFVEHREGAYQSGGYELEITNCDFKFGVPAR
jgi:hypothetical protein